MTAASTPKGQKYGYVFRNCRFTGNSSRESVYLGRPWRDYARTVLIDCYLGPHICPEGWHDWDKRMRAPPCFTGNTQAMDGAGGQEAADRYAAGQDAAGQDAADQGTRDRGTSRPDWVFMLTRDQIQDYTMEQVLGGTDGWNPGT